MKRSIASAALLTTAALTSGALAATTLAPVATAQTAAQELSSALSSTRGSGNHDYRVDPDNPGVEVPKETPLGSAYTGIAPLSLGIALAATVAVLQILVDLTPPLRQAVDNAAAQFGLAHLPGSSEGNRILDVERALAQLGGN